MITNPLELLGIRPSKDTKERQESAVKALEATDYQRLKYLSQEYLLFKELFKYTDNPCKVDLIYKDALENEIIYFLLTLKLKCFIVDTEHTIKYSVDSDELTIERKDCHNEHHR